MKIVVIAAGLALSWSAVANADSQPKPAVPPQYTVDDVTKSFTQAPSEATSSQAPSADAAAAGGKGICESQGQVTGPDGLCYPNNASTAGFNLGRRAMTPTAQRPARVQRASAPQESRMKPQKDLLITFRLGSADLTDQGRANAQVFATALKEAPQLAGAKFQLSGYTDSKGRVDRNLELSQRRADAVKAFLIAQGVDGARLTTKGYGARDFLPGLPSGAEENRRVVAVKE